MSRSTAPRSPRQFLRRIVSALVTTAVVGGLAVTEVQPVAATSAASAAAVPAPAAPTDGTANFTWSMPERFGQDANNDHLIDMIDDVTEAAQAHPSSWNVDFNACEANGAPRADATYSWTFSDGSGGASPPTSPSAECATTHSYPAVDVAYTVSLTVVDPTATATTTQTIVPRDYVIVIMGDSASSGEGNPDWLDADWTRGGTDAVFVPKWNNEQCHRSALSGQAQAAIRLEQRDPHSSVTFVHVGCSGARITRGVLSPYQGIVNKAHPSVDCDDPNLANPYKPGQSFYIKYPDPKLDAPNPQAAGCLPSQIDQVESIVGERAIDAVSIVAGINDLFFSKPIMACLLEADCTTAHSTVLLDGQNRLQTAAEFIAPRFAQLQDRYAAMFDTIMSRFTFRAADPALGITPGHIFLAEYPNSGQNPDGTPCNSNELNIVQKAPNWVKESVKYLLQGLATSPDAGTFSAKEWAWATDNILNPLNAAGQTAVTAANTKYPGRVSVVTGSTHAFDAHGYCAKDTWMQSVGTSFLYQRDPEGSFHPNRAGHFYGFALPLEAALATQFGVTAPALEPKLPGDIEALQGISQAFAPFLEVMGRTNIVEELDKIFPIRPGLPSKKSTDWAGIIDAVFSGIASHVGNIVAARGLSEADVFLDDIDGINGPDNDGRIGDVIVDVSGEISPHTLTSQYEVLLHIKAHGPSASLNWSMAGLSLGGGGSDLDIDTTLRFIVEPGNENQPFRAYLPAADNSGITFRLTAEQELPASASTTAQLGPIDVVAHGPVGGKAVSIDTGLTLSLADPNGDGRITLDEMTGASFDGLFDVTCTTGSHVDVDVALDAGLPGLTSEVGRLRLHDTNVCDGINTPTITFAQPDFEGLINMGTNEVLDLAIALANSLERLQAAGVIELPFTDSQLRDALDLVAKIRALADDPAAKVKTSLQTLVAKLEQTLGLEPGSMNLRFDAAAKRFLFDLTFNPRVDNVTVPVDLGVLAGAGLLGADASASVTVSASAAITLHLAFDITPDPAGTTNENLRSVSDRLLISTTSSATFDGSASVKANASATVGLLPVDVALDNGSGGAQNLIVKRDPAKSLAEVTISGPQPWVSLADLLSGDPARASVNAQLNAALNPTTITARASLNGTELGTGHVTVTWNDLSKLSGVDGPKVTADASYGAAIARFAEAANDPIELLSLILGGVRDSAKAAVDLARTNEQLARSLPLIGSGYDDVVKGFQAISDAANTLASLHTKLTLPQFELALETAVAQALGVDPASVTNVISLTLDRSQPRTALVLHVDLCQASAASAACGAVRPVQGSFSFNANGLGIVGTAGQTSLALDYLARLKLDLALELPSVNLPDATHDTIYIAAGEAPAGLYVLGSSRVDVRLDATANGSLSAYVGPFAVSLGITGTKAGQPFSDPANINAKIAFAVSSGGPASERLTPGAWLTKVQQNLATNGVTQPIDSLCTPNTVQGCAVLPVYFKTVGGDVTAADGSTWVKLGTDPISFTAPRLLDPSSYTATVPQAILDDFANRAFSASSLITAIQYLLEQAKVALDGDKIGQELPIVGKVYAAGSSLINDINSVLAKLNQLAATIEQQTTAGNVRNQIRSWLFTNLGPSSPLKLILDRNGDNAVTVADIDVIVMCGGTVCTDSQSLLAIKDVKIVMSIGKTASASSPAIDFGIKGLQIKSDAAASASIGWHLDVSVGVDGSGVYVDPSGVGNRPELGVSIDASLPAAFDATILGLPIAVTDNHVGKDVDIDLGVDVLGTADQRLRLPDLLGRGDNTNDRSTLGFTIKGCSDLQVGFEVAVPGVASPDALPAILGDIDFHADWNGCPGTPGAGRDIRDGLSPTAMFAMKNIRLDVGKLASRWIGKVVKEIQRVTSPIQPVIREVTKPIPIVSDLAKLVGKEQVTWLKAWAAGQRATGNDVTAIETMVALLDFVNTFNAGAAPNVTIPIADDINIDLTQAQFLFADPDEAFDKLIAGTPVIKDVLAELSGTGWNIESKIAAVAREDKGATFSFPALEKPSLLLQMLFGKDVDLAVFDAGTLRAENGFDYFYGLPVAKVGIRGSASIEGHVALSYDTAGIRRTIATKPLKWSSLGALVHGFGINDLDSEGNDVPEIRLDASLALYAYAGVPGANVSAEGGVEGYLQADLIDPDGDGKVRYDEIKARISNPRCLFETTGLIQAFARLKGQLGPFSGTKDIVKPYVFMEFSSVESWCRQVEQGNGGQPLPQPVLAEINPNDFRELNINVGTRATRRNMGGDDGEIVTINDLGDGRVQVTMFGITQEFGSTTQKITNVRAFPNLGNDKIYVSGPGGPGDSGLVYVIQGGPGDDTIQTGRAQDQILGDAGNDVLSGRDGNDIIIGGDGNDTIDGGLGGDTINGDTAGSAGAGNDAIDGGDGDDRIYPMSGADVVVGGAGNDVIDGGQSLTNGLVGGPDFLEGGEGADGVYGSTDADIIIGGVDTAGSVGVHDTLWGNGGDDCIVGDNGSGSFATVNGAFVCQVEAYDDTINERDSVLGGQGSDTILGGAGDDRLDGDDEINRDTGNDVIDGGLGNDILLGAGGDDTLVGFDGDDNLSGEDGNDHLAGGKGIDTMSGGNGNDEVLGGDGNDIARGDAGDDTVIGDAGDDQLDGFVSSINSTTMVDGNDIVEGGEGNDIALAGPGNDRVSGGVGNDTLSAETGNDTLLGGPGTDTVDGGAGNDLLRGGDGNDQLTGRAGDDRLEGDAGNDVLGGDAVRYNPLTPSTFPSGAQRVQPRFDLNFAGADTYDGGSGDDFVYDVDITPKSEVARQGLRLVVTDPADHGTSTGTVVDYLYSAAAGYKGDDSIGINITDGSGNVLGSGRISISNGQNHAPVANDDSAETDRGLVVQGNVLTNDLDVDGDSLRVTAASGATAGGTFSVVATGGFTYTPAKSYAASADSFTYTVTDPDGSTATATVHITIRGDRVGPVVSCDQPAGWSRTEVTVTCTAVDAISGLANPAQGSFQLTSDLGAGNEGPTPIDPPSVCDNSGNCTDRSAFTVNVDRQAPTIASANDGQVYGLNAPAIREVTCVDGGSGIAADCFGNGLPLDTSTPGAHAFTVAAADNVGNTATRTITYTVVGAPDTTAPVVSCTVPSGWSATEVAVPCVATDSGSGFPSGNQSTFTLTSAIGAGNEGPASLDPQPVCDQAANCTDLPPFTVQVDRKAPSVASTNDGATYQSTQTGLTKNVTCADGGSGLAQTTCPQHGQALDMSVGPHSFTVTVTDRVGNSTTRTFTYTVVVAPPAGVTVSVENVSITEGNLLAVAMVPVRLSQASRTPVAVNYRVAAGTAGSNDAVLPFTGSLTFTPDRRTGLTPTVQYIYVIIIGDRIDEPNETINVTITATGAPVARGAATVTIIDDDPPRR